MELNESLDWVDQSEYVDDDGEYSSGFIVDSDEKAAWALRKYKAAVAKNDEAAALAASEITRIERWLDERRRINNRDVDFFAALLQNYALSERRERDRKKIDLPDGVVQTRQSSQRFKLVDKAVFVEWAKENAPSALRVVYTPDMSVVSRVFVMAGDSAVDDSGVVVPGVGVEHERITATIAVHEKEDSSGN